MSADQHSRTAQNRGLKHHSFIHSFVLYHLSQHTMRETYSRFVVLHWSNNQHEPNTISKLSRPDIFFRVKSVTGILHYINRYVLALDPDSMTFNPPWRIFAALWSTYREHNNSRKSGMPLTKSLNAIE